MQRSFTISVMVFLLIFSLLSFQIVPSVAGAKDVHSKVRVAFLGIHFEKIPARVQQNIQQRIETLLNEQTAFDVISQKEIDRSVDSALLKSALETADLTQFLTIANKMDADYLFAGNLANQSRDNSRVLLVGELYRMDRKAGLLNKFDVLKYYDNLGVELVKFENNYIKTIVPVTSNKKTLWPWMVVAGVAVAGLIAMSLTSSKFGSKGEPGDTRPVKP